MTAPIPEPGPYRLVGPTEDGKFNDLLASLDAQASNLRLQALIAEWLRMENLVVLAGAGTSVSCGGHTMATLEKKVLSVVKTIKGISPEILAIIETREKDLVLPPAERIGFEDWLSFVANAAQITASSTSPLGGVIWRGTSSPIHNDLEGFISYLGKAIFAECALILPDAKPSAASTSDVPPHLAFLAKLVARDSNLGRAHLFTLNYDTLFEQALELLGIQYFDGFTGRAAARFDPSVYGLDIYYPGEVAEGRVRRFDKFLHLYKLHGSIHWRVDGQELRAQHPNLSEFEEYRVLADPDKSAFLTEFAKRIPSVGILPTANKFAKTLTMPFAHIFRSFQIRLSAPQTFLLVLGYGFGDDHVNHIIEGALMNPSLVMLVVEPDFDSRTIDRVRRYKDLGKRAFILSPTGEAFTTKKWEKASFDDFARAVMPDVRWLDDFLRLRRFEKQIKSSSDAGDPGTATVK
jgi:SIR2-like domain